MCGCTNEKLSSCTELKNMGVKELWPTVESVMEVKSFDELKGQTIAVDLSMWIVDSQCVKQMAGVVVKPHLRNLFFRVSALLQADILPVFVVEGKAPELKWQTMSDRQNTRTRKHSTQPYQAMAKRANRKNFNSVIKECVEMLDYLGVPHLQANGEAEALCAALNQATLVDAVITEDGDAFLYGARTVYKNFTITKTPTVESYSMHDIETQTGLYREHLISLALLVGCDYCPKGVPGVGKIQALKLCHLIPHQHILSRLRLWSSRGVSDLEDVSEKAVAQKISRMDSTNFHQVIQEFMNEACKLPLSVGVWKKPLISKAQSFNLEKLEWPINYSLEKMLPLLVLWCMMTLRDGAVCGQSCIGVEPEKIVKKRVRQGVQCLEVLWKVSDPYEVDEEDSKKPKFTTIEALDQLSECYPTLVEQFLLSKTEKPKKTAKTKKTLPKSNENVQPPVTLEDTSLSDTKENHSLNDLQYCFTHLTTQDSKPPEEILGELTVVDIIADSRLPNIVRMASKPRAKYSSTLPDTVLTCDCPRAITMNKVELSVHGKLDELPDSVRFDSPIARNSKSIPLISLGDSGVKLYQSGDSLVLPENDSTDSSLPIYKLNGSSGCSPLSKFSSLSAGNSLKLMKPKPRNSIDALLDDISRDLDSPAHTTNRVDASYIQSPQDFPPTFLVDSPNSDSIITGYVTPARNLAISDAVQGSESKQIADSMYLPEANSTVSLFDVKSEAKSDISLFDVKSDIVDCTHCFGPDSKILSTNSSPLLKSNEQRKDLTSGNFDIVPDLSALNFTD